MDVVKTDSGYVSGTVLGNREKPVSVFRGIPYAAPPVGDLRWKPPQPVASWSGIRECTRFSAIAPQSRPGFSSALAGGLVESEDCLYLNVLTPARTDAERLPVMVQMHTGGFTTQSGNDEGTNSPILPSKGVVLVNFNARLGPLGCLAHPLLSKESSQSVSGNYLFLDSIAALKWVQRNISTFGGDPGNVTIFGQSGGGSKVLNLMASRLAKGLFHRAVSQSSPAVTGTPLRELEARGERMFAKLGVDREPDPLAAARAIPWQKIIEAGLAMAAELKMPGGGWDSAIDGWFLHDTLPNTFEAAKHNVVPLIIGGTLGELTGPGVIIWPQTVTGYVRLLEASWRAGGRAYAYIFDRVPAGWKREGAVSFHAADLAYLFGEGDYSSVDWATLFGLAKASGAKSPIPETDEDDRRVSATMMGLWTSFAKTGYPSMKGVAWPVWDATKDQYLYITEKPEVRSGFSKVAQK